MRGSADIRFEKWEGAGNDFVLIEAGDLPTTRPPSEWARVLCPRRTAVGADGLLVIDGGQADYWNADGSPAGFCGNGARCVARYLLERDQRERVDFRMGAVAVRGWREADEIAVGVPAPGSPEPVEAEALLGDRAVEVEEAFRIEAGVPHLLLRCAHAPSGALLAAAPELRGAVAGGTNVDLTWTDEGGSIRLRTFERGLPAETHACGSGVLAAARYWAGGTGALSIVTQGGARLRVEIRDEGWMLQGPARRIFRAATGPGGTID